jgi:hypothetical protein
MQPEEKQRQLKESLLADKEDVVAVHLGRGQ